MAMATAGVVEKVCDGDPSRLRRISVRFSKPVALEQKIETRMWRGEPEGGVQVVEFETYDSNGQCVLNNGRAEVSIP